MTPGDLFGVVPNFSEGRRADVIDAIVEALHVPGARVVYAEADPDHHRLDTTVLGDADAVRRSAIAGRRRVAVERIDMTAARRRSPTDGRRRRDPVHAGARSVDGAMRRRWPVGSVASSPTRSTCPSTSTTGRRCDPERASLADVRRGQFEGLREAVGGRGAAPRLRSARDRARRRDRGGSPQALGGVQRLPRRHRRAGRQGDRARRSASPTAGCLPSARSGSRCPNAAGSSRCR